MPVVAVALRYKRSEVGLVDFAGPWSLHPVVFQEEDTNRRQFWQENVLGCNSAALSRDLGKALQGSRNLSCNLGSLRPTLQCGDLQREQVCDLIVIEVGASDSIGCVTCSYNTPPIVGNVSMNDRGAKWLSIPAAVFVLSAVAPVLRATVLQVVNLG